MPDVKIAVFIDLQALTTEPPIMVVSFKQRPVVEDTYRKAIEQLSLLVYFIPFTPQLNFILWKHIDTFDQVNAELVLYNFSLFLNARILWVLFGLFRS